MSETFKTRFILTGNVEALGGGAFLLNIASEIASYGRVSSFCITNNGLSHLLLGLGASNRIIRAFNLKNTKILI